MGRRPEKKAPRKPKQKLGRARQRIKKEDGAAERKGRPGTGGQSAAANARRTAAGRAIARGKAKRGETAMRPEKNPAGTKKRSKPDSSLYRKTNTPAAPASRNPDSISSRAAPRPLTSGQRKHLRGLAHHLQPVVHVGKHLITERLTDEVSGSLESHELIKIKFLDGKGERQVLAEQIAAATNSSLVSFVGNVAILYREQRQTEKRKIRLR